MSKLEQLEFKTKKLEKVDCPLCRGKNFDFVVKEHGLKMVRCENCHFVFCNPRPTKNELARFYGDYYPEDSENLWEEQMAKIFKQEGLKPLAGKKGKALDIGCGYGFFLKLLKENGWQIFGTEIAAKPAAWARKMLGKNIFCGELKTAHYQNDFFDLVSFWYVLEHLPEPLEELKEACRILKKDCLLIIRVPNANARFDKIISFLPARRAGKLFLINPPRHLNDFTAKTMKMMLQKVGFTKIKIKNAIPRKTGTKLQLLRRKIAYCLAQTIYYLTFGQVVSGSSMVVYAKK